MYETIKASIVITADSDVDSARIDAKSVPTNAANHVHRLNMLDRWARLIAFAGGDLSPYVAHNTRIRKHIKDPGEALFRAIDAAFSGLERIYAHFKGTPEGQLFQPRANYDAANYREWPLFHGNSQNTGATDDPGPTKGKLAWKFPIGRPWYSRLAVENGKVYAVSNGMTTILYCLDEETGNVDWKATQRGNGHQYGTARMNSSVIVQENRCIVREVGSGGDAGEQKYLIYVDKANGDVLKQEYAGHIDYRVGYAPLEGNESFVVYSRGLQTIHWAKERTITTFDRVVCRDSQTDELLWEHNVGAYWTEPKLDAGQIFVGTTVGKVICLDAGCESEHVRWMFKAGAAVNAKLSVDKNTVVAGAENGIIYGLDRDTGDRRWTFAIEEVETRAFQQFSSAEIAGDRVYIGCADSFLYCLDLTKGKLVWRKNLRDWVRAKPLFYNDHIYTATLDGRVYKFTTDGELVWVKQPTGHQIFADLVRGDGHIFLNSSDLYLHCLDAETGLEKWRRSLMEAVYSQNERVWADIDGGGGDFQSPPIVAEGMVIAAGPDRFVHALDHESGKEMWRFECRGQIPAAPIYCGGNIYFGQQGGTSDYYCLSAKTGKVIWKKEIGWGWASANAVDGKVYIPTVSGWVYCVDAKTGETVWEYDTENGAYPAPAVEGDVVVFGSWNNMYYGFNKDTGEKLWEVNIHGHPDSGAALVKDGKVYLQGLYSRYFFCNDLKTGEEVWKFQIPEGYECNMSPAIHKGKVFFSVFVTMSVCTNLIPAITFCLDATTGEKIWEMNGGGGLTGIAIANGRAYFASTNDPYLWCVDEHGNGDGTTKVYWKFKMTGRVEESCVAIACGKAFILATDGFLYAVE